MAAGFWTSGYSRAGLLGIDYCSAQRSQSASSASLGMRQSPRGDRLIVPTFGPSGKQEGLNWLAKTRRRTTLSEKASETFQGLKMFLKFFLS